MTITVLAMSVFLGTLGSTGLMLMFNGGLWQQPLGTFLVAMAIAVALAFQQMILAAVKASSGCDRCPKCRGVIT